MERYISIYFVSFLFCRTALIVILFCLINFMFLDGAFRRTQIRLSAKSIEYISQSLQKCKMPHEIHRATRGLDCLSRWKATEYRTMLLYTGFVVLKGQLPFEVYQNFLVLFCAIKICESKTFTRYLPLAEMLIDEFIETFLDIYGEAYMTSNVHNLAHLVDDVTMFGELQSISTYPFENTLQFIKKLIRNGRNPLAQVAKRITEKFRFDCGLYRSSESKNSEVVLTKQNIGENVPSTFYLATNDENRLTFYSKIDLGNFCLTTDTANKWFFTRKNEIACLENILSVGNKVSLYCRIITNKKDFFETPIKSSALNIFSINYSSNETCNTWKLLQIDDIQCKFVFIEFAGDYSEKKCDVLIPLEHTYCFK